MTAEIRRKYTDLQMDFQRRLCSGKLGKMSMSDFRAVAETGEELLRRHEARTVVKNVADYFSSFGFPVAPDSDGISFVIVEA